MDPLTQLADAIVADLASAAVRAAMPLPYDVSREYAPAFNPSEKPNAENAKAKVFVSGVDEASELGSRSHVENVATVQIVVGAWTLTSRAAADAVIGLAAAIAGRYRQQDNRTVTYDTDKQAVILTINRVAVYDVEQFRAGLCIGAINLGIRWDEDI